MMYVHESSTLVTTLIEHEKTQDDLKKASNVWVIALDTSIDNEWKLWINGESVSVSHGMVKMYLRKKGLIE